MEDSRVPFPAEDPDRPQHPGCLRPELASRRRQDFQSPVRRRATRATTSTANGTTPIAQSVTAWPFSAFCPFLDQGVEDHDSNG